MATTDWNGGNRAPQPDANYGKGYDVITTDMQATQTGANAWLSDSGDNAHVLLTVVAVETSLSLSGSEGQAQMQKDFYPKNFQQPSFTITCQARSQQDIGRVAEFVHKAQRNSVSQGALMTLIIPSGGLSKTAATIRHQGMKGIRKGIQADGYVKSMPRSHKRHDPAPQFEFEFVVSRMHVGVFQDQPYKVYKLATWSEIVDSVLKDNFIGAPLTVQEQEQQQVVQDASDAVQSIGGFFGDLLGG